MSCRLLHVVTVPETLSFLAGQPAYLRARGFETHVISSDGEYRKIFEHNERTPVTVVPMQRRITVLRDLIALTRIVSVIWRLRPAIVHGHTPKGGLLGMIAAWIANVPVRIYHLHGLPFVTARGFRRVLLIGTEWLSCRLATDALCVSHSLRDMAVRYRLCPSAKVRVIAAGSINGVDAQRRFNPRRYRSERETLRAKYGIPSDAMVLGFVGRVVRDKGMLELARAWNRLQQEFPGLHLLIVGPMEQQDPLPRSLVEEMQQDPRVHLHGLDYNVPPLLAAMDILVLPTYREGFPVVLIEASSMGLPVVATRVVGCTDAVRDGSTGLLVLPRDSKALYFAIAKYLRDPEMRTRHGAAGRARVLRDFRPEPIWGALHSVYVQSLNRSRISAQHELTERAVPLRTGE
jgi:glycosyltransferase involved in cell wall biosynthesis